MKEINCDAMNKLGYTAVIYVALLGATAYSARTGMIILPPDPLGPVSMNVDAFGSRAEKSTTVKICYLQQYGRCLCCFCQQDSRISFLEFHILSTIIIFALSVSHYISICITPGLGAYCSSVCLFSHKTVVVYVILKWLTKNIPEGSQI